MMANQNMIQFWTDRNIFDDWGVSIEIYEALCFDVVQGQMNGAPNETGE